MWECKKCHESVEESFEVCWNCGTSRDGIEDPDFRPEVEGEVTTAFPISTVCPRCGCAAYSTCRPAGFLAFRGLFTFVQDRVCKSCNARYTPPTPTWAAILFIVAGLPVAGSMALSIIVRLAAMVRVTIDNNPLRPPAITGEAFLGMARDGIFAFIGMLWMEHGIRALRRANPTS